MQNQTQTSDVISPSEFGLLIRAVLPIDNMLVHHENGGCIRFDSTEYYLKYTKCDDGYYTIDLCDSDDEVVIHLFGEVLVGIPDDEILAMFKQALRTHLQFEIRKVDALHLMS